VFDVHREWEKTAISECISALGMGKTAINEGFKCTGNGKKQL